ncbi:hypothetical protein EVAR_58016_1 [Eumeta japonica]|uniref:Uncharacterized protein n=1 Tax=Eumeta variegata TaxID=151549 RepID=A0A4C1YB43_EUMVA|nr:hypothetical protein EVAR_58016_1 [Eumeta japonica]
MRRGERNDRYTKRNVAENRKKITFRNPPIGRAAPAPRTIDHRLDIEHTSALCLLTCNEEMTVYIESKGGGKRTCRSSYKSPSPTIAHGMGESRQRITFKALKFPQSWNTNPSGRTVLGISYS